MERLKPLRENPFRGVDFFYVPELEDGASRVDVTGDEYVHLVRASRHRIGDRVALTNGRGLAALGRVRAIGAGVAQVEVERFYLNFGESERPLMLAVSMIQTSRFDWLVEKATELGVVRIIPLLTRRTVTRLNRAHLARSRRVAIAAAKQSQRCVVPAIADPAPFEAFVEEAPPAGFESFLAHERVESRVERLSQLVPAEACGVLAVVGPEGGFTEEEVAAAEKKGYHVVSLGVRRLRSETAALLLSVLLLNILE